MIDYTTMQKLRNLRDALAQEEDVRAHAIKHGVKIVTGFINPGSNLQVLKTDGLTWVSIPQKCVIEIKGALRSDGMVYFGDLKRKLEFRVAKGYINRYHEETK